MTHKNKVGILLKPSITSASISVLIIIGILLGTSWGRFKHYQFSQQLLDSFDEISTSINQASGSREALLKSFFASSWFNQGMYIVMWASVGMLAYFLVIIFQKGAGNLYEVLSIRSNVNLNKKTAMNDVLIRNIFKLFIICISYIYLVLLFQIIIPVSVLCIQAGVGFNSLSDIAYILMGVLLLALSLHFVTVLLRLIFLRVRVFGGGQEVILES